MGIVNSRESNFTESFCESLKRSMRGRPGSFALDDVDAPGVGAGDEAALLENEAEQLVDVALGRRWRARSR